MAPSAAVNHQCVCCLEGSHDTDALLQTLLLHARQKSQHTTSNPEATGKSQIILGSGAVSPTWAFPSPKKATIVPPLSPPGCPCEPLMGPNRSLALFGHRSHAHAQVAYGEAR